MAKRFHDTEIWKEDWFLSLPLNYREFWFYILDSCDHAGIWKPNFLVANSLYGFKVVENQSPFEVKDKNGKTLFFLRLEFCRSISF